VEFENHKHGITIHPSPDGPICDFCSSPEVTRDFNATDFLNTTVPDTIVGDLEIRSNGGWAACELCGCLIDAEQWEQLLDVSCQTFTRQYGEVPNLREGILAIHSQFRQARIPHRL
jgi:hypothetical protein